MKNGKKGLTLVFAIIFVLSIALTGCGGSKSAGGNGGNSASSSGSSSSSGTSSASGSTSKNKGPLVTLKMVYETTPQKDLKKVQDAINKYIGPKYNLNVNIQQIDWGQWTDKVNLMIASREPVDVLFAASWDNFSTNVAKGAYLALNDPNLTVHGKKIGNLIAQYGKGITKTMNPLFLKGSKINGINYAIPTDKELAFQGGIVYRTDWAKKLGLTDKIKAIKSIDDLEPILKVVKNKMPGVSPIWLGNGGTLIAFTNDYDSLGDSSIPGVILKDKKSTKVFDQLQDSYYKHEMNVVRKLYTEGLVDQDAATSTVGGDQALGAGKAFMIPEPLKPGKANEVAIAENLQGKLDQVGITDKTVSTGEPTGAMLSVPTTSKHPIEAMKLINLLHTDKKLVNMIDFGIEGVHYTKVSDNIIKATPNTKNYAPGVAWEIGNQFLNYIWNTEDPHKWEKFRQFNKEAIPSPGLGFNFNSDPVKTQVGAIANIIKEYQKPLETGSVDPAKVLPQYEAKEKAAGLDQIIAEKQKQFNAWLAKQKK